MATSTIKHNRDLVLFTGTIPDATGDYTISNFFPTTTYIPIAAFYRTSYSQFRPVSVGFLPGDSRGVVLIGLTESMKGRDLRVYALPIV